MTGTSLRCSMTCTGTSDLLVSWSLRRSSRRHHEKVPALKPRCRANSRAMTSPRTASHSSVCLRHHRALLLFLAIAASECIFKRTREAWHRATRHTTRPQPSGYDEIRKKLEALSTIRSASTMPNGPQTRSLPLAYRLRIMDAQALARAWDRYLETHNCKASPHGATTQF